MLSGVEAPFIHLHISTTLNVTLRFSLATLKNHFRSFTLERNAISVTQYSWLLPLEAHNAREP